MSEELFTDEQPKRAGYYWFRFEDIPEFGTMSDEIIKVQESSDGKLIAMAHGLAHVPSIEDLAKAGGRFGPEIVLPSKAGESV